MKRGIITVVGLVALVTLGVAGTGASPKLQTPKGRKIAFLVGVSNYGGTEGCIKDLAKAHSDATNLAQALKSLGWQPILAISAPGGPEQVSFATKERILNSLKEIAADSQPEDTFLFYFSGHGMTTGSEGYLWPSDGRFERVGLDWKPRLKTLVSFGELESVFRTMKARKRVLVSDACREERTEVVRDEPAGLNVRTIVKDDTDISKLNSKLGEVVSADFQISSAALYSCIVGEYSWETDEGGVYTGALIDALARDEEAADARGRITPALVKTVVAKKVANWSQRTGRRQTPEAVIRERDPIILGVRAVAPVPPQGVPSPAGPDYSTVGAILNQTGPSTTPEGTENLDDSISLVNGSIIARTNLDRWHRLVYSHKLIDRDAETDEELAAFEGETTLSQKKGTDSEATYEVSFSLQEWSLRPYRGGGEKNLSFTYKPVQFRVNRQAGYGKPAVPTLQEVAKAEDKLRDTYWKAFNYSNGGTKPEGYHWGMYFGAVTEVVSAAFRFGVNREERERREYRSAYIDDGILYVNSGNAKGEGRKLQYDVRTGFLLQIEDTEIVVNPTSNRKVKKTHLVVLDARKSMIRK